MFTGLIIGTGIVHNTVPFGGGRKILIRWAGFLNTDLSAGDSVAIDGVCLSLEKLNGDTAQFVAVEETIKKTTLSALNKGDYVNIELPARPDSLLNGHIVQGHIDTIGKISSFAQSGAQRTLKVTFSREFSKYVVPKGSIAIDGISLTTVDCGSGWITSAVIPDTIMRTTLKHKKAGDNVNIEFDILAKYIDSLLARREQFHDDDIAAAY